MIVVAAHYDGKVIVPDEPIPLPAGTRVRIKAYVVGSDERIRGLTGGELLKVAELIDKEYR